MKRFIVIACIVLQQTAIAQIVKINPSSAGSEEGLEIIFDAKQGTAGLVGATSVYMHSGVVIASPAGTSWEYVKGNWGKDDGLGKMTKVPGQTDVWSIKLSSIRAYYGIPEAITVFRLAMVFRNADGSKEGKGNPGNFSGGVVAANRDIFIDLNVKNYVQLLAPVENELFIQKGASIPVKIQASGQANELSFLVDSGKGFELVSEQENARTLDYNFEVTHSGKFVFKVQAVFEQDTVLLIKDIRINQLRSVFTKELPEGIRKGINYTSDPGKVVLVLEAPGKDFVYAVGDFSDWEPKDDFLMNKTPDGELFWLELEGLEAGKEYVFQYWVNGTIKIGDPYADKVADPWNDGFIPSEVYPDLPPYVRQEFGVASVLQTGQQPFIWAESEKNFVRPDKNNLIIYELLVRDFMGSHHYRDLTDTLTYLKRLGVNAIELMPIMEFEGNESWGYNPSYFFAPDKYYGSKNELKKFIEEAHKQGFAVILDMVLNHAFGQNSLVKMYWDAPNNRPSADNPWFNQEATHPFNVGYDFNHESSYTKAFVDSVNRYWLSEYHFDGYRFDLSKGFTQRQNSDVGRWSARDDSRIALLKRMATKIWEADSKAYVILEHFADASEENELRAAGMLTWGNDNHDFANLMKGNTNVTLTGTDDANRVSYMESHDEQRQMFLAKNASVALKSTYDPRIEYIALNRLKLMAAFFYTQPGPKMMWQFQELGYDIDINFNGRVGNKPLVWGAGSLNYYTEAERQKLYKTHAAIIHLVNENRKVFSEGQLTRNMNSPVKSLTYNHEVMKVSVLGNFDIRNAEANYTFPQNGWWYDYFQNDSIQVTGPVKFELSPGEFHLFTSVKQPRTEDSLITFFEARDTLIVRSPVVWATPEKFDKNTTVTFTFDAEQADAAGTAGLLGADKVYMHAGIITSSENGTDWQHVVGNWGKDDGVGRMTRVQGTNTWEITLRPRDYFKSVPASATWYRMGMVFRNADGTREGKGMGGSDLFLNFSQVTEQALGKEKRVDIAVYPNPANDIIRIDSVMGLKKWILINEQGQMVHTGKNTRVELNNLPSGIYLLQILTSDGVQTKKIVRL